MIERPHTAVARPRDSNSHFSANGFRCEFRITRGKRSKACARTDSDPERLKMYRLRASPMLQLGFGRIVTTISRRLIDKCRYVDFTQDERCPVFLSVLEELRASLRYRNHHGISKCERGRFFTVSLTSDRGSPRISFHCEQWRMLVCQTPGTAAGLRSH
jgi:hypothetical protein